MFYDIKQGLQVPSNHLAKSQLIPSSNSRIRPLKVSDEITIFYPFVLPTYLKFFFMNKFETLKLWVF